ncbi:DUF6528 family protein [Actinoplanes regularis]|uniref:Tachylectin n=1 Tax=Actinoplanes regularis TaxID=52697 RepID=A0A239AE25_9ACTN|nr:DUF6528 family protein [Actinoplanes regularis]GIE86928.1 hypothetical protein Are01nite_34080 [Actinoplanes regularis]SNR93294.1 hypothetical protein SAMN06264365_107237 [Actinoplanes regularis]
MITRGSGAALAALISGLSLVAVAPATAAAATSDYKILAGDQNTNKIYRLDPATSAWEGWTWAPTAARGFSAAEIAGFNGGNDFRIRDTPAGQRLVVVDGAGLATVATYPEGDRVWANKAPGTDNRHSIELMPDGNVAVAATDGGYVRVYSTSSGSSATFALQQAHAALWDPVIQRLWVAGSPGFGTDDEVQVLKALEVTGPASAPGLREDPARTRVLSNGKDAVHDVSADPVDPDKLWITTNGRVYTYDKATRELTGAGAGIDRGAVKSISGQPSGQIVQTQADYYKNPAGACGSINKWCTATLDFFGPAKSVTRSGAQFYKARVANPHYGVEDLVQRGAVFDTAGGTATRIDGNLKIGQIAATADTDGRLHVLTLIPGSGMWSRTRGTDGAWEVPATQADSSARITDAAIVADPDGNLHAFTLVPGSGVWYRVRPAGGAWATTSKQVDASADVTSIAAVVNPVTERLHLLTAGASGVRDRTGSTAGVWNSTAMQVDGNTNIADVSAAALPDGGLHLFAVTAWGSVYHRTGDDTAWTGSASLLPGGGESPATGQVRALAVAGWPASQLDLVTVRSGLGVWNQTWSGGSWPAPVRGDADPGALQAYAARLADGTLHTGKITEIS